MNPLIAATMISAGIATPRPAASPTVEPPVDFCSDKDELFADILVDKLEKVDEIALVDVVVVVGIELVILK